MKLLEITLLGLCDMHCDYCISGSNTGYKLKLSDGRSIPQVIKFITDNNGFPIIKEYEESFDESTKLEIIESGVFTKYQAMDAYKLLDYIGKYYDKWDLVISGGEPLLYPGIDSLLEILSSDHKITLLTNLNSIQKFPNICKLDNIFFRIGYHPEFRKIEPFIENMYFLTKFTNNYIINYVLHPRHIEKKSYIKYLGYLDENNFVYEVSYFKGEWKDKVYGFDNREEWSNGLLSDHYIDEFPEDRKLIPGKTLIYMEANGSAYACHKKMGYVAGLDSTEEPIFYGELDWYKCLGKGTCSCDSMRASNNVFNIRK